jgi:Fe-S cluster biogenesis protein NfuA
MTTEEKIKETIAKTISPALQTHGGNVSFEGFDEANGTLFVKLIGACGTCPFAQETLRMTVEAAIMQEVPEVKSVVQK